MVDMYVGTYTYSKPIAAYNIYYYVCQQDPFYWALNKIFWLKKDYKQTQCEV